MQQKDPPVKKWGVVITVMLGLCIVIMDFNVVTVALPAMMDSFKVSTERIKLVVESYGLSYAIFTLTGAWLRERIGIRRTFNTGLLIFIAASVMCGISWDLPSNLVFRVLQGAGGGIMAPTGFTALSESFPRHERGKAFGVMGSVIVFAPSIAPTLGGYLVEFINWRYIFYINIPLGAITFVMTLLTIRDTRPLRPVRFDWWGFIGMSIFLVTALAAFNKGRELGWGSPAIITLFVLALGGMALYLIVDSRIPNPIMSLELFKNRAFSLLAILHTMRCFVLFGRIVLMPLLFQTVLGFPPFMTGMLLMPGALSAGLTMPAIGPLVDRYGPRWFIIMGCVIQAAACFMYWNIGPEFSKAQIVAPIIIFGFGSGMCATPITSTSMNVVRRYQIGLVSIVHTVILQVASAFGAAVCGVLVFMRAAHHQAALGADAALLQGYRDVFILIGVVIALCIIPALGIWNIGVFTKPECSKSKAQPI